MKRLVDTFSILADQKDVQKQVLLFTEDATVESITDGKVGSALKGREQIVKAFAADSPGDVRVVDREDPKISEPTDAIITLSATRICGSDLWPYRGVEPVDHQVMGHEYVGVVEEIGSAVTTMKVGDFVVGSFVISDNTCERHRRGARRGRHRQDQGAYQGLRRALGNRSRGHARVDDAGD